MRKSVPSKILITARFPKQGVEGVSERDWAILFDWEEAVETRWEFMDRYELVVMHELGDSFKPWEVDTSSKTVEGW